MRLPDRVIVTCEHGGNRVPREYAWAFRGAGRALQSHRGHDPGALALARRIASRFRAPLVASTVSRLVVELNRSLHHPKVFSEWAQRLPRKARERIVIDHYTPHRTRIERLIRRNTTAGRRVLHLIVHTFTPRLNGVTRTAEIGLLFDPARRAESAFCRAWQDRIEARAPRYRVRLNYPYSGDDDGFTTALRKTFPVRLYVGIELEINQRLVVGNTRERRAVHTAVVTSLVDLLD